MELTHSTLFFRFIMKSKLTYRSYLTLAVIAFSFVSELLFAQSTSVFDANYFDKDNMAPPIKIGRGFHINDIYRQTRACFTPESSNAKKLTPQQVGGKKTSIKLLYTATHAEYNKFKTTGASGRISFLNLFTLGGKKLEEYTDTEIHDEERLIFVANVDFGIYSFDTDPILIPEAKNLIAQGKSVDFIRNFGTHYISGIRKESSIVVILKKKDAYNEQSHSDVYGINLALNIPRMKSSFEVSDDERTKNYVSHNEFDVTVNINGPAILQSGEIKNQVESILSGNSENKLSEINAIISNTMKNISDPNQSLITQYYYTPFNLYGIEGINWNEKKQNELIRINESVIDLYAVSSKLGEMITPAGKNKVQKEIIYRLEMSAYENMNKISTQHIQKITEKYTEILPSLKELKNAADNLMIELENRYNACSDISCISLLQCCNSREIIEKIENADFNGKIQKHLNEIELVLNGIIQEVNIPDCQTKQFGIIRIQNLSLNPYILYNNTDGSYIDTVLGKEEKVFNVGIGNYNLKAVQKSGFLMYPTVNYRTANILQICQEVVIQIGFE